jgi:hypothetical protein
MLGKEKNFNSSNPFEKPKQKLIAFAAILSALFVFNPNQTLASQPTEQQLKTSNIEQLLALNPYAGGIHEEFTDQGKTEIEVDPNLEMIDGKLVPITEIQQPVQTQPQVVAHNYPTIFTPEQLREIKNSASKINPNPNPEAITVPVLRF